jgi:hypothetical protein
LPRQRFAHGRVVTQSAIRGAAGGAILNAELLVAAVMPANKPKESLMQIYGRHAVANIFRSFVAYRNIRPIDARLPGLISPNTQPRRRRRSLCQCGDDDFARPIVTSSRIQRFMMIGDTRQSDGGTYLTIAKRSGWQGAAFICDEKRSKDPFYGISNDAGVYTSNRWRHIDAFAAQHVVDQHTAIPIDLDKTFIGARGRNHQLIDAARLTALKSAVTTVLGNNYNDAVFSETYHRFNQPRFHRFTGDNQDFLAFICVMAGGWCVTPDGLQSMLEQGIMRDFSHYVDLS